MTIATLNGLVAETQAVVELTPEAAELLSRPSVTIRRIAASTFRALFPPIPTAILEGIPQGLTGAAFDAALGEQERRYLASAPGPERRRYLVELEAVKFAAVALAMVDPPMTEAEVERLGDDVLPLYVRLLEISKLGRKASESAPVET